jgi:hypothetical protein
VVPCQAHSQAGRLPPWRVGPHAAG